MQEQQRLPDDLISLADACRILPHRNGKRFHVSALFRWGWNGRITLYQKTGRCMVSESELKAKFRTRRGPARQAPLSPQPEQSDEYPRSHLLTAFPPLKNIPRNQTGSTQ